MEFNFAVTKGEISPNDLAKINEGVKALFDDRFGKVRVTMYPVPIDELSEKVRRYYWMLCKKIANYLTESGSPRKAYQIHEVNKKVYFSKEFMNLINLGVYEQIESHKDSSTKQLLDICEMMKVDWAEKGLRLPDINENRGNDGLKRF